MDEDNRKFAAFSETMAEIIRLNANDFVQSYPIH